MDETDDTTAGTGTPDPIAFTREHLTAISKVWMTYAKEQADAYKDKLPESVKQLLKPKAPEAASEPADAGAA